MKYQVRAKAAGPTGWGLLAARFRKAYSPWVDLLQGMLRKAAVTGVTVFACSGPAVEPSVETEPSRTHVVATVERHA
ncbi:MAG TPA: hypothetical protein VIV60_22685, partial [Polyangiaceae bacterium]